MTSETDKNIGNLFAELNTSLLESKKSTFDGLPNHDGDLLEAESVRNITRIASSAQLNSMESDPMFPYLAKTISVQRRVVLPGADTVYHVAILDGGHNYRLFGERGSCHLFELEVWRGHVSDLFNFEFHSTLDTFSCEPGGELDVCLSHTKPEKGDWIELPEGECTLLVRQYYYDWETEQPAILAIEREGAMFPPPPIDMPFVTERIKRMTDMVRTYPMAARHGVSQHLAAEFNAMDLADVNIGFVKLRYLHGKYDVKPDEAIILEVKPPKAHFWNFQLLNLQWECIDYHMRQSSINGFQAHLNSDGIFRMIISHQDPGVENWLDTSGRTFGLLSGRYYDPDSAPIPTLKKVPFSELSEHLPNDMKIMSKEERQHSIKRRMLSTIRRLCAD